MLLLVLLVINLVVKVMCDVRYIYTVLSVYVTYRYINVCVYDVLIVYKIICVCRCS